MAIRHQDPRDEQTAQRLRQFGLLEVLLLTTCLAVTLGLFRQSYHGVGLAIGLTFTLAVLLWQTKRIDRPSDVPIQFQSAALAVLSLLVEGFTAWLWGFTGGAYYAFFVLVSLARALCMLLAASSSLDELIRIVARKPLDWEDQGARVGLTGRLAIVVLWMPLLFSWPLSDIGTLHIAQSVGTQDVVADALKSRSISRKTPALNRLNISRKSSYGQDHFLSSSVAEYRIQRTAQGAWTLDVCTRTMPWTRVGDWQP